MNAPQPGVARPLRAWRQAQLAEVATAVQRACVDWGADWGVHLPEPVTCRMPCSADLDLPWQDLGGASDRDAWLHLPVGLQDALCATLFEGATGRTTLVSRVGAACLAAWRQKLSSVFDALGASCRRVSLDEALEAWSGWVCVHLPLGAKLMLDGATARVLVARTAPGIGGMTAVEDALAPQAFTLQVRLGECELDFGSLQDLQAGDVLRLPHAVTAPADVVDAEGRRLFQGALVRSGSRKAVELVSAPARA